MKRFHFHRWLIGIGVFVVSAAVIFHIMNFDHGNVKTVALEKIQGAMEIVTKLGKQVFSSLPPVYPQISLSEQGAHQEFAFEAPTDGYTPTLDWPMHATGSTVGGHYLDKDLYFCFGQPKRYGHVHFLTDGSGRRIQLSYSINLTAGDRNLETYPDTN